MAPGALLFVCPSTPRAGPDVALANAETVVALTEELVATIALKFVLVTIAVSETLTSKAFTVVAVTVFAAMFPEPSRFTIAFAIFDPVGATVQSRFSVPAPVTGDPLTLTSDAGAARATLVTVPLPGPRKVWPLANVRSPLLLSCNPFPVAPP